MKTVTCTSCGAKFPELDECGHPSVVAVMAQTIRNALDNACHGREGFAYRQLAAVIGEDQDEDYIAFIEAQERHERQRKGKR